MGYAMFRLCRRLQPGHRRLGHRQRDEMRSMFEFRLRLHQGIGGWDTGSVTNMSFMFSFASAFNRDIGGWDTGNVTT